MKGQLRVWLWFALGVAVLVGVLARLSISALALSRSEAVARELSHRDALARDALWRMDSQLAPLVAVESARPSADFHAGAIVPVVAGQTLADCIRLRFQLEANGCLDTAWASGEAVSERMRSMIQASGLIAAISEPQQSMLVVAEAQGERTRRDPQAKGDLSARQQVLQVTANALQQGYGNSNANVNASARNSGDASAREPFTLMDPMDQPASAQVELMRPLWLDADHLALVRQSSQAGAHVEGCVLDATSLRERLRVLVADLLPQAALRRAEGGGGHPVTSATPATGDSYPLAALPLALDPGPLAAPATWSPLAAMLAVAWACALAALAAMGALLAGAVSLSERRAMFVSAVTHELRTPITSLRMYAEMLDEGMVVEPAQRARYLATVRAEAERLGSLVENVLSYARLERASDAARLLGTTAGELIARCCDRLERRSTEAGMTLSISCADDAAAAPLRVDAESVERILVNLVDNACKYASRVQDRRIELDVTAGADAIRMRVRDHGPGVARDVHRRLFSAFAKSASVAAHSAPGVGLGLALSRRLARRMGGDLALEPSQDGAAFVLTLPRHPPSA